MTSSAVKTVPRPAIDRAPVTTRGHDLSLHTTGTSPRVNSARSVPATGTSAPLLSSSSDTSFGSKGRIPTSRKSVRSAYPVRESDAAPEMQRMSSGVLNCFPASRHSRAASWTRDRTLGW